MSSAADIRTRASNPVMKAIFGDPVVIEDKDDLFYLAENTNKSNFKPKVYMCVGFDDFLYEDNIKLKNKFETLDYDFTFSESEGAHNWDFWDEYVQYILEWMFG